MNIKEKLMIYFLLNKEVQSIRNGMREYLKAKDFDILVEDFDDFK